MYVVTNKAKDVRKFRDRFLGKDILLNPGESTFTKRPPVSSDIWEVEKSRNIEKSNHIEKPEKKTKIKSREVKKMKEKKLENDSSSN